MMETPLAVAPVGDGAPAPDPGSLLKQWVTHRLENVALRLENAAPRQRVRELEAQLGRCYRSAVLKTNLSRVDERAMQEAVDARDRGWQWDWALVMRPSSMKLPLEPHERRHHECNCGSV